MEEDLPNLKLTSDSEPSEDDKIAELSQSARKELIPQRSAAKYNKVFQDFHHFLADNGKSLSDATSECVLAYFYHSKDRYAASTLWSRLSCIKKNLVAEGISIDVSQTTAFLKSLSREHKPAKASVFSRAQIEDFLDRYPQVHVKLAVLVELCGAMRKVEACSLTFSDFQRYDTHLVVRIEQKQNGHEPLRIPFFCMRDDGFPQRCPVRLYDEYISELKKFRVILEGESCLFDTNLKFILGRFFHQFNVKSKHWERTGLATCPKKFANF